MTRRRLECDDIVDLRGALIAVLQETVKFLDCPLSDDQMVAIWHDGYPPEITAALDTMIAHRFMRPDEQRASWTPTFVVKELNVGMRWRLRDEKPRFTNLVAHGPFRFTFVKINQRDMRPTPWEAFQKHLSAGEIADVAEWAKSAADCTVRQEEATITVDAICRMLSTAGQLRRMVPDLVGYLPPSLQAAVMEQQRASPYPADWAAYPKDRVERMIAALAEGHLCKGIGKRDLRDGHFSWASYLPK